MTQKDAEGSLEQVRRLNGSVLPSVELSIALVSAVTLLLWIKGLFVCVDKRGWETLFA